jgi:diguanylate cyclase (GGDEF)-like protein
MSMRERDIPEDQMTPEVRDALARMADENALLRAALSETRGRLSELEDSADSDALTGLPNDRRFHLELERVVSHANRHGTPAALLSIEIAGLPAINARHGLVAGDAALAHVARLLKGLIRTSDVAARTGGTGFALILDHLDSDSAIDTAERISRCIAENPLDLGSARVSLEAGVAVSTILKGDTAEDVLRRAARNLERLKEF